MVYLPPAFTETRTEVLIEHVERHDFGLLVSHGKEGLIASQLPFLLERRDGVLYLQGHLARANPQLADLDGDSEALAIFAGPHAYISPSWYQPGPAVPTWNYATVHVYGAARTIADPGWLRDFVRRLTERHEAREPAPPSRSQSWYSSSRSETKVSPKAAMMPNTASAVAAPSPEMNPAARP